MILCIYVRVLEFQRIFCIGKSPSNRGKICSPSFHLQDEETIEVSCGFCSHV